MWAFAKNLTNSPTEAGQVLFGYSPKQAYDTWSQWKNDKKKPSKPTNAFFRAILILEQAEKEKTKGAELALSILIERLKLENTNLTPKDNKMATIKPEQSEGSGLELREKVINVLF